jgi:hypothetical protein
MIYIKRKTELKPVKKVLIIKDRFQVQDVGVFQTTLNLKINTKNESQNKAIVLFRR